MTSTVTTIYSTCIQGKPNRGFSVASFCFDTYYYYSCIHVNLWEGGVSLISKFIILKRKQFWEQHITYLTQSYNTFNCLPIFLSGTAGSLTVPSKEEKHFPDLKWSSFISDITWKRIIILLTWFVLYLNNFKCVTGLTRI